MSLRVWLALALAVVATAAQGCGPLVQTAYGTVRGTHHAHAGYSSFTGIRYAQAPTGRNRFRSASPPPSWDGIFEANRNDIACPEIAPANNTFIGIEDCLTLNVHTPDVATPGNPVAVIVYFHGGRFMDESVIVYHEDFLIKHEVVVVLVNFRLGAFGYLCLRHELIPGNAAFKDQVAALRWVQQNIRAFGGDPDNVTIMGHSSGAVMVDLLSLSPMTEGLFNKTISVSGTALIFWAVKSDPIKSATTMAQLYLDYDGDSIEDLVEFYLNVDNETLSQATLQYFYDLQHTTFSVGACVERPLPGVEAFLIDAPADIIKSRKKIITPHIYGMATREYVNTLSLFEAENAKKSMHNLERLLPNDLVFRSDQQRTEIADRVREFYLNNKTSALESYVDYKSDTFFYNGIFQAARKRAALGTAPVYVFKFAYESERRLPRLPVTQEMNGTGHADDKFFVIDCTTQGIPLTAEDQLIIDKYSTLVTNFAKYINPTPDPEDPQWLPLTKDQFHYLKLDSQITPSVAPYPKAIIFWDQIYADVKNQSMHQCHPHPDQTFNGNVLN